MFPTPYVLLVIGDFTFNAGINALLMLLQIKSRQLLMSYFLSPPLPNLGFITAQLMQCNIIASPLSNATEVSTFTSVGKVKCWLSGHANGPTKFLINTRTALKSSFVG